jgi:Major Facilitator Superfamily
MMINDTITTTNATLQSTDTLSLPLSSHILRLKKRAWQLIFQYGSVLVSFLFQFTTKFATKQTMCRPTKTTVVVDDDHDDDGVASTTQSQLKDQQQQQQQQRDKGFLYGTLSLALVVTASTVVMGHSQSKRDKLGCDTVCVGGMTSARSTLTLLGSTIVGRGSDLKSLDKFGGARRFFLLAGIAASAIELLIASQSDSLTGLWISLIPAALLQQNFNVLKALFGEYHDESASAAERAGSVGKLGMAAGLAFMAGPLLSSVVLPTYNDAALFASVCLVLALWFVVQLPTPTRSIKKQSLDDNAKPTQESDKSSYWWNRLIPDLVPAARTPPALFIMSCRICMALSFHIFQTIWAVALKERFHFGPKDYGRYYSFIGFGFAMSQGFLAKALLKQFGNTRHGRTRLLLVCALILGGGRFLAYHTSNLVHVYALFGLIIVALGLINTIFTADTSKIASPDELGGLFGVLSSVESLAGIAGPIVGGLLSNQFHPVGGPLGAVLTLYGIVFGLVYWRYEEVVMRGMMSQVQQREDGIYPEKKQMKVD